MRIGHVRVQNYGCLKDTDFEAQPLTIFVGSNGQGKSLIVEALYRFFTDFSVVGGASSIPVTDILWEKRVTKSPIKIAVTIELEDNEVKELLPFDAKVLKFLKTTSKEYNKISIKRSLEISGSWKTDEITWAELPLVTDDVLAKTEIIHRELLPLILNGAKKYKMHLFPQAPSGVIKLVVKRGSKTAFTTNALFEELVGTGTIETSPNKHLEESAVEWAAQKGLSIAAPPSEIPEIQPVTTSTIQKISTTMALLRGKLKLIPAARDNRDIAGNRVPLVENSIRTNITSTSISRVREQEIIWEKYRTKVEKLLRRRLEPNPSEILVKEGDLGLNMGQIGGGEQTMMGLVWETLIADKIYAIEEPENHLYPRKQKELFEYFNDLSKETQVIICTHSPIFASRSDICGVYLVSKDEYENTQAEEVNESNVNRVIDELGIRASYQLEYDNVVFVEGDDDVKIFNAIAKSVVKDTDTTIGFIDAGGWNSMDYYANARLLKVKRVKVGVAVIFDGDTENVDRNKKTKEKLLKELKIGEESIFTLKESSIEAYLLNGRAIKRAFPTIGLSRIEIDGLIKSSENKKNKKKVLDNILKRGGIGKYNGKLGAQIVQSMTDKEINEELKGVLKSIVSLEKPHEKAPSKSQK